MFSDDSKPYNSYGNGVAMCVSVNFTLDEISATYKLNETCQHTVPQWISIEARTVAGIVEMSLGTKEIEVGQENQMVYCTYDR